MKILLTNDDGVYTEGIQLLKKHLEQRADVVVVAPELNQSATGHSLSLKKPVRMTHLDGKAYAVDGFPADCIRLALMNKVFEEDPNIIISGINDGYNMGQDVYYSGTVAAAREGAILSIPSLAISIEADNSSNKREYDCAIKVLDIVLEKLDKVKEADGDQKLLHNWPLGTLININVPNIPYDQLKGIRLTKQGHQFYGLEKDKRKDHRDKAYYWIGGTYAGFKRVEGSDCVLSDDKYASVCPLRLDCTDYDFLERYDEIFV